MSWRTMTLGELVAEGGGSIQTGPFGSQLHAADYVSVGTPSVMPQNIGDNRINEADTARVSDDDMQRLTKYWLAEGDIVYSRRGDVERRALVRAENDGWLCGTGCLRVRVGDDQIHDPAFVSYALGLAESRKWIVQHAVGATMLNLNTGILGGVPISVPSISVQRGIAEVLGALDDKIAANVQALDAASSLAIALAQSDRMVRLDEIVDQVKGVVNPASFGSALVSHFSLPAFDVGSGPELVAGDSIKSNKTRIEGNTVLISKLNPRFPRIWDVIATGDLPALASTEFVSVTSSSIPSSVLWAALSAPTFASALESKVAGTSGSHQRVKPADLLATEIADPRSLSASAAAAIADLGEMRHALQHETSHLAATRDALLPLLMSGKVTVKDAESVVGEVL